MVGDLDDEALEHQVLLDLFVGAPRDDSSPVSEVGLG